MTRPLKLLLASLLTLLAPASQAMAGQTLYTNSYFEKEVAAVSIGADGTLTPLTGSPFTVGQTPEGLAISPDSRTIVIGSAFGKTLRTRALADDGSLAATGPELNPAAVMPVPAISPDGRFVYVGSQAGGVLTYSLASDGTLTPVGANAVGSALAFSGPAVTPDGRFLFLPNRLTGEIERFSLGGDGTPALLPGGPATASGGGVVGMRLTPDGKFAIVLNVGSKSWVRAFAVGSDGSLAEVPSSLAEIPDSTTAGLVVSPNGRFAYVANHNEANIRAFEVGADGSLRAVGSPVKAELSGPEALAMSDSGRFLFAQPEDGELVQAFAVAADGTLTKVGGNVKTDGGSDHTFPVPRPAVPKAALRAGTAAPGKQVAFDTAGSSDLGAAIVGYGWDFGDGKKETTPGPQAKHAYKKAGDYQVSVTVLDDAGCTGFVYTGQSAYCNGREATASAKVDTLPAISNLKLKRRKGRAFLAFGLEERVKVAITIKRKSGRKLRALGALRANGKPGPNKVKLPGKLKGRRLKPGSYVAIAIATDSAGGRSAPAKVKFRLKP